jgi:RNA polymerase sigma-70 factor (ECF subfamily)
MPGSEETYKETPVILLSKEQTFDYFFRQYYAALCFFAQSIIHHQEDSKDIVQDCFIKLWDDITITEKAGSVKAFLYIMVRNRCIDYLRQQKVRTKAAIHLQPAEKDETYFDELAFAEMVRQVLEDIEKLPKNMRIILKKYYLHGEKYNKIAAELTTTPDAVRMQKNRALKLLKIRIQLVLPAGIPALLALLP